MRKSKEFAWLVLGITFCIFLTGFSSGELDTTFYCGGDSETYIQCFGDDEINFLGKLTEEGLVSFGVGGFKITEGKIFGFEPIIFWLLFAFGVLLLLIIFFLIAYLEN